MFRFSFIYRTDKSKKTQTPFWITSLNQNGTQSPKKRWTKQSQNVSILFTDQLLPNYNKHKIVFRTVIQRAGTHMEHTLLASYVSLLIGYLIMDSAANQSRVRKLVRNCSFTAMVQVLDKYYTFMNLTASVSETRHTFLTSECITI